MAQATPRQVMQTYLNDIVSGGQLELIDELFHPDMIDEAAIAFGGPTGRAGLVGHVKGFRRHIGNLEMTIKEIVAGSDQVMAEWSFTGTHDGPWLGRQPTHERISGTVFSYFTLGDGQVVRYRLWLYASLDEPVVFDSSRPGSV